MQLDSAPRSVGKRACEADEDAVIPQVASEHRPAISCDGLLDCR